MQNFYKRMMQFAWVALLMVVVPMIVKTATPDTDTFFLMTTGRYIVETGTVPTINPFVIHEGFEMVVQQWGFDIIMYELYDHFGNPGLIAYILVAYTLMLALLNRYIGLFTKNSWTKAIVMLISGTIFLPFATARPTSFTILSFISLLYCVEQYQRTSKTKYLIPLPIISLMQINMQSSTWPLLFVLIIPYIFPHNLYKKDQTTNALRQWWDKYRRLLFTMGLMLGLGFVNPNGWNGILYVFQSYTNVSSKCQISELMPPALTSKFGILCIMAIVTLTVFVTIRVPKIKTGLSGLHDDITRFYMAAGTTLLACMHLRNSWYLIIGVMPMIAVMMDKLPAPPIKQSEQSNVKCILKLACTFILPCILSVVLCISANYSQFSSVDNPFAPKEAVKYLDTLPKESITLYNEFNAGAYMEWEGYQVYFDARPELFSIEINKKEDVLTEYSQLESGEADYQAFLDKYNFTHLIVSNPLFAMYLDMHENYQVVVEGNQYALYERVM